MSEPNAAGTPAETPSTVQNPPAAPPAQAPAPAQQEDPNLVRMTSDKLKERLDETRAKAAREAAAAKEAEIAKELGMTVAEAKALAAAHKAAEDAKRSEVERLTSERDALKAKAAELDEYKGAVTLHTQAELTVLSEEQRAAVIKLAGDSPAKQLTAIETLRPTWQSAEQAKASAEKAAVEAAKIKAEADAKAAAEAAAEAAKKTPLAAPASTSAANAAPPGTAPVSTNHLATFEALMKLNEMRAADYFRQHEAAIKAAQRARATA
jgi:hypothetical protein